MFGSSRQPNRIDTITIPDASGALGLVACPGFRLGQANSNGRSAGNVRRDLQAILRWKASGVVTLMEEHELVLMGVHELPELIEKHGLWWRYLPIQDMYVPDDRFEHSW